MAEGQFVTINDALREWLLPISKRTGPIIPVKGAAIKRALCEAAGATIPHDTLRHAFATCHYAPHNDAALTAREMKPATTEMTFKHYVRRDVVRDPAAGVRAQRDPDAEGAVNLRMDHSTRLPPLI